MSSSRRLCNMYLRKYYWPNFQCRMLTPALHRATLQQYFRKVIVTFLTRMQTSKTDKYVYHFVYFLGFCLAISSEGLTPDYIVGEVEAIQPQ